VHPSRRDHLSLCGVPQRIVRGTGLELLLTARSTNGFRPKNTTIGFRRRLPISIALSSAGLSTARCARRIQ
jgi:hypothetical protein